METETNNIVSVEEEELILRRVFGLTFLNTLQYATYREALNPERSNDMINASDYTIIDYNYVSIKRKTTHLIVRSILDQPGKTTLTEETVYNYLALLSGRVSDISLPPYKLDEKGTSLISDTRDFCRTRFLVIHEQCPRTSNFTCSFLVSFLKSKLPDLMGDTKVEQLYCQGLKPSITKNADVCLCCFMAERSTVYMRSDFIARIKDENDVECPSCKDIILKVEKLHITQAK